MEGKGEVLIYQTEDGKSELEVRLDKKLFGLLKTKWDLFLKRAKNYL
jgi:hypothetical protein